MDDSSFEQLVISVHEGGAILQGAAAPSRVFAPEDPNVKHIRARYGLSQSEFSALLGISLRTLQRWEQGICSPRGPARVLLLVASRHPAAIWDIVRQIHNGLK